MMPDAYVATLLVLSGFTGIALLLDWTRRGGREGR